MHAVAPATITGAVQFDMTSGTNGRRYRVYVWTPRRECPPGGYPVVYITDGNAFFGTAAMQAGMLEETGEVDPGLIVGIGYPGDDRVEPDLLRLRDLTWECPDVGTREDYAAYFGSRDISYGGAEEFFRFIKKSVEPTIAATHRIDRGRRAIFGDSLGGLFALYLLFRYPQEFRAYIAGSPSIWWNDRAILREMQGFREKVLAREASPRVLITVGALEQDTNATRAPRGMSRERFEHNVRQARMVDNARELAATLYAIRGTEHYRVACHVFEGETHQSVVAATISRAIKFALTV